MLHAKKVYKGKESRGKKLYKFLTSALDEVNDHFHIILATVSLRKEPNNTHLTGGRFDCGNIKRKILS
jgi:hypothetical protein